jgi:hypothetical protein
MIVQCLGDAWEPLAPSESRLKDEAAKVSVD